MPAVAIELILQRAIVTTEMQIRQSRATGMWAALGVLLAGLWQAATVQANFGGNWTALFCTGDAQEVPPALTPGTFVFQGSTGYDGQWYRYIAHDPLVRGDMHTFIDAPPLRYRRILVPGLAAVLAFGQPNLVDRLYIAVTLGFVFAGCYWCAIWAARQGKHAAWGLLFLAVPATLISLDRMTIDIALAALASGAVVYWDARQFARCYFCLAAGCLARETGVLIVGGWVVAQIVQKNWGRAALFASAVVPAAAWFLYLRALLPKTPAEQSIPGWLFRWDSGIVGRMFDPVHYGFAQPLEAVVRGTDGVALAGMLSLFILAGIAGFQRRKDAPALAASLHLALFAIVNLKGFWDNVYGYARPFSAMIVLTAMSLPWSGKLRLALLLATAAIDTRIFMQFAPQAIGICRYWLG